MSAEALLQQEVELWQDCLNMEHRISVWENDSKWPDKINSKIQNREHSINSLTRLSIGSKNLPAEVNEFQVSIFQQIENKNIPFHIVSCKENKTF